MIVKQMLRVFNSYLEFEKIYQIIKFFLKCKSEPGMLNLVYLYLIDHLVASCKYHIPIFFVLRISATFLKLMLLHKSLIHLLISMGRC